MKKREMKKFLPGVAVGFFLAVFVMLVLHLSGIRLFPSTSLADNIYERAQIVESYIDRYYWKKDISEQTMSEYAAKGMVAALGDKYSYYYTSDELKESLEDVEGDYDGIGASIAWDKKSGEKKITEVQKGTPAEKAGLKKDDVIVRVGDVEMAQKSLDEVVKLIRGKEGKESVLTVSRQEKGKKVTKVITVATEKIVSQTVSYKMMEDKIGYIMITSFNKETVEQYEKALENLEQKGQKALIVDLRNNGGGSLTAVIDMLDRMLPKGDLITEKNRVSGDKLYTSTDEKHFDKPAAILINGESASASEVFAGCMQVRGAAVLVGEKSYGKGIVQTIFSLEKSCGGGIKLTTGEYLLPGKRSIHEKGLTPDVEVKYTGAGKKIGGKDDNQLQRAVEVMKEKVNE